MINLLLSWNLAFFLSVLFWVSFANASGKSSVDENVVRALGLYELVDLAVLDHPNVLVKMSELDADSANVIAAQRQFYPAPSLTTRKQDGDNIAVLMLEQPVWTGGRLSAALTAAEAQEGVSRLSILVAQFDLALRVTSVYRQWMMAKGRVEVLERDVARLNGYVKTIQRRVRSGVSSQVDLALVSARLAQSLSDLSGEQAAERSALAQLAQIVGRPLRSQDVSVADMLGETHVLLGVGEIVEQAMLSYPAIRRSTAAIDEARAQSRVFRAELMPTLSLRAQKAWGGSVANSLYDGEDAQIYLAFEYAPGSGFSKAAKVGAAEARVSGLLANREAVRRELTEQVYTDYEDYLSGRIQGQMMRKIFVATKRVLESYQRMFAVGKRSWLDVLNASRELTQVENLEVDLAAQMAEKHYRLQAYMGSVSWLKGGEI